MSENNIVLEGQFFPRQLIGDKIRKTKYSNKGKLNPLYLSLENTLYSSIVPF